MGSYIAVDMSVSLDIFYGCGTSKILYVAVDHTAPHHDNDSTLVYEECPCNVRRRSFEVQGFNMTG